MRVATARCGPDSPMQKLVCCLCGTEDYDSMHVEQIGIAVGPQGEDYSFCRDCWLSKTLGQDILDMLGYPEGLKLIDSAVTIKEAGA